MPVTWQLQDAKNKFSEVVQEAVEHGPQVITRHGIETVVIVSMSDYRKMTSRSNSIVDFFRNSPLVGADVDMTRDVSPIRPDLEL